MLMHADGQPGPSRHSFGVVGSLAIHVMLMAAWLSWGGAGRPADPIESGRRAERHTPRLSQPVVRPGLGAGSGAENQELPWAGAAAGSVSQAEPPGLQLGVGLIIDHVWQSTLFAIGAGLLTLACRNRAALRYALWLSASVKFLVPFSLIVWFGSVIAPSPDAMRRPSDSPGVAGFRRALPQPDTGDSARMGQLQNRTPDSPVSGRSSSLAPVAAARAALWPSTVTVSEVTLTWLTAAPLAVWTCGFYAVTASGVRRSRRYWDAVQRSRRVRLIDVKTPARLQVGLVDGPLEPGVIGWMHPVLLLPADIECHLTRPEIEAIIAHQLCHVRRFDNMTATMHMAVEAIFWFHPLVWRLGIRLRDERARACDEHVLRTIDAPGPYAQGILNICERYVESPLASVSSVRSVNLRQRIDAILANHAGEAASVWKRLILSAALTCAVIIPLVLGALPTPGAADREPILCPQLVGRSETSSITHVLEGASEDHPIGSGASRCVSDLGNR